MSDSKKRNPAKKSLVAWIFEFAGEKKGQYIVSVFFALFSGSRGAAPARFDAPRQSASL